MKKVIMLLLIVFLFTGCADVNYDLRIAKDLSVNESVNISATEKYFNNFYMNLPITIVKGSYENMDLMSPLVKNKYSYELKKDNLPYPSVFVQKKYSSISDYAVSTIFKGQSFEKINISEDNNLITLNATDFIKYAPEDSGGDSDNYFPVSKLNVNITLPFVVTNNNADKVIQKTNTYIWYINEETTNKEINLVFDKTKIYINNISLYISIVILVLIILVGIIYVCKLIKKNKSNNYV